MSLGNWHGGRHRWEAPIGRSSQSFPWERSPSDGTSSYAPRARSHTQLRYQGANQKEIARAVARCPSTISRELRRNSTAGEYYSTQAQWKAAQRRRERPLARKMDDPAVNEAVRRGLAQESGAAADRRTDAAARRPRRVSSQTIYTWIKQDANREHWESFLRRRGKRPYRRKNAATSGDAARIDQRPEVIEERLRLGDFEGDTVLGPAGTGGLATLVDRKSRFTIVVKVQSKNADHVHAKIGSSTEFVG